MVFSKFPSQAKIEKSVYSFRYQRRVERGKFLGLCHHDTKKIQVAMSEGKKEAEKTVIHELIHAVAFEIDLELSEKKVVALEDAIYSLLEKNGWKLTIP